MIKSTSLQIDILSRVQAPANLSICNIALQFGPRELNLSWRRLLKLLGGVSSVVFIRTAHRRLRHSFADDALKRDIRVPYAPHQRRQSKDCLLFLCIFSDDNQNSCAALAAQTYLGVSSAEATPQLLLTKHKNRCIRKYTYNHIRRLSSPVIPLCRLSWPPPTYSAVTILFFSITVTVILISHIVAKIRHIGKYT